jgi:hypothetical protein
MECELNGTSMGDFYKTGTRDWNVHISFIICRKNYMQHDCRVLLYKNVFKELVCEDWDLIERSAVQSYWFYKNKEFIASGILI